MTLANPLKRGKQVAPYAQVIEVAKSGTFKSGIKEALDSITDATASKRYCVLIASGDYTETAGVPAKPNVDIMALGPVKISSGVSPALDLDWNQRVIGNLRAHYTGSGAGTDQAVAIRMKISGYQATSDIFESQVIDGLTGVVESAQTSAPSSAAILVTVDDTSASSEDPVFGEQIVRNCLAMNMASTSGGYDIGIFVGQESGNQYVEVPVTIRACQAYGPGAGMLIQSGIDDINETYRDFTMFDSFANGYNEDDSGAVGIFMQGPGKLYHCRAVSDSVDGYGYECSFEYSPNGGTLELHDCQGFAIEGDPGGDPGETDDGFGLQIDTAGTPVIHLIGGKYRGGTTNGADLAFEDGETQVDEILQVNSNTDYTSIGTGLTLSDPRSGKATISNGTNTVTVTNSIVTTASVIVVTPTQRVQDASNDMIWWATPGANQFTINTPNNVNGNTVFAWRVAKA